VTIPCSNTDWREPEDTPEGTHIHMHYDFSSEPEDLTRFTDHEVGLMHAQATGQLKAALGEVVKLRAAIYNIVVERAG